MILFWDLDKICSKLVYKPESSLFIHMKFRNIDISNKESVQALTSKIKEADF